MQYEIISDDSQYSDNQVVVVNIYEDKSIGL